MKTASLWLLVAALTVGLAGPLLAQAQPAVTLDVLNAVTPGTNVAVVVQGDLVLVQYAVSPLVDSSPSDLIRLRRLDNGTVVSEQMRGDLTGTASLDTTPSAALGDLEVVYVLSDTGAVLGAAPEIVRVVPSGEGGPSSVVVPSTAAPTIQAAIDLVADGGTINIRPGTYRERLLIVGKRVKLVGSGVFGLRRTLIVGALPQVVVPYQQAEGLISFGPRGGGSVSNLILQGGDAGVVGFADARGTPAAVQVKNAVIRRTGRGVLGSFGALAIEQVAIWGTLSNGIAVLAHSGVMDLVNGIVGDVGGVAVMIYNFDDSTGAINIVGELIGNFEDGGIVIAGGANLVFITNCLISGGKTVGILLAYAGDVYIWHSHVNQIAYGDPGSGPVVYDNVADGLIAVGTDYVNVYDCNFYLCERSGMLFAFGNGGLIGTTTSGVGNRFGLVLQDGPTPDYTDNANNFFGTEQGVLTDGALPVPEPPPLPEEP